MKNSQPFDSFIDSKAELSNLYKVLQDVMDAISVGRTRLPNRDVYLFALNKIYLNLFVVWKHNPKKMFGIYLYNMDAFNLSMNSMRADKTLVVPDKAFIKSLSLKTSKDFVKTFTS